MTRTLAFVPLLGLMASISPAVAQERLPASLTQSIAREAVRLGTEAVLVAQDSSVSADQTAAARPARVLPTGTRVRVTAESVVDVPGLIRLDARVALRPSRRTPPEPSSRAMRTA